MSSCGYVAPRSPVVIPGNLHIMLALDFASLPRTSVQNIMDVMIEEKSQAGALTKNSEFGRSCSKK